MLRKEWIERLKLLGRQGVPQSTDFLISFFFKLGTVYFIDGTGQCRAAQAPPLLQGVCDENCGGQEIFSVLRDELGQGLPCG